MTLTESKGLTLIELIIVLAIIAIIGAILAPNFITATDKAKLKSDVQSARIIFNQMSLYNAEQATPAPTSQGMAKVLEALNEKGYLTTKESHIQTPGAQWRYGKTADGEDAVLVDISACTDSKIKTDTYKKLSSQEIKYITGGS